MNKMYIKAPVVLGSICVVSAGLIGGLHTLANWYSESHKSSDAPETIKSLNPNATFTAVEGFESFKKIGDNTPVTVEACYEMYEGGKKTGYAYTVDAGKPVKTEVEFTVAFQGDVTEATILDLRPLAVNIITGGDSGYDDILKTYAAAIVDGTKTLEDDADIISGATKSQKYFRDGLTIAREDYCSRWNGETPEPEPDVPGQILKVYPTAIAATEDDGFEGASFTTTVKDNGKSLKTTETIVSRYHVTLQDGTKAVAYSGTLDSPSVSGYNAEASGAMTLWAGYSGEVVEGHESDIRVDNVFVENSSYSYDQWETDYLPGVLDGSTDLDDTSVIKNGATVTSGGIRKILAGMRNDYYKMVLAEQAADVEKSFKNIYGDEYQSYVADEFTPVSKGESANYKSLDISNRYTVTLTSGTAKVYLGSVTATVQTDKPEGEDLSAALFVGFSETGDAVTDIRPDGYSVKSSTFSYDFWKTDYLPGIIDGTKDLDSDEDVECRATYSAKAVRDLMQEMRADYFSTLTK